MKCRHCGTFFKDGDLIVPVLRFNAARTPQDLDLDSKFICFRHVKEVLFR